MFDLTQFDSLEGLHDWISIVRKDNSTLPLVLLGSKFDLIEESHGEVIPEENIKVFMEQYHIRSHLRVSSKTGLNVNEAFATLVDQIIEAKGLSLPGSAQVVD